MRRPLPAIAVAGLLAVAWLAMTAARVRADEPTPAMDAPAPDAPASGASPPWDRQISDVLSPGPLAAAHADLEGVTHCNDCHSWLGATPNEACLACHEEIGKRMAEHAGYHGKLEGRCADCHVDHRGADVDLLGLDHETFAHDQALFALRGAHAEVACDDCHVRTNEKTGRKAFHPIGTARNCAGCHESPHGDRLVRERDCESCHVPSAWTAPLPAADGPGFDHDADTRFVLDAIHRSVACSDCHEPHGPDEPRQAPPHECSGCHADAAALLAGRFGGRKVAPDPHAKAATCRDCHSETIARPSLVDYAAACVKCHPDSYASLLATRRALLDEALVSARLAANRPADRRTIDQLARSGLHHSELAEAVALDLARTETR